MQQDRLQFIYKLDPIHFKYNSMASTSLRDGNSALVSPYAANSIEMTESISVHITGTRRVQEKVKTIVYFCIELGFHGIFWSLELRYVTTESERELQRFIVPLSSILYNHECDRR